MKLKTKLSAGRASWDGNREVRPTASSSCQFIATEKTQRRTSRADEDHDRDEPPGDGSANGSGEVNGRRARTVSGSKATQVSFRDREYGVKKSE